MSRAQRRALLAGLTVAVVVAHAAVLVAAAPPRAPHSANTGPPVQWIASLPPADPAGDGGQAKDAAPAPDAAPPPPSPPPTRAVDPTEVPAPEPAPILAPTPTPTPTVQPARDTRPGMQPIPAPSLNGISTITSFNPPGLLDVPARTRSAPDLDLVGDLPWSGLPIRLRLFIDEHGKVVDTAVLESSDPDEVLARVRQMFLTTLFTPAGIGGQDVPSYKDIEITVGSRH